MSPQDCSSHEPVKRNREKQRHLLEQHHAGFEEPHIYKTLQSCSERNTLNQLEGKKKMLSGKKKEKEKKNLNFEKSSCAAIAFCLVADGEGCYNLQGHNSSIEISSAAPKAQPCLHASVWLPPACTTGGMFCSPQHGCCLYQS